MRTHDRLKGIVAGHALCTVLLQTPELIIFEYNKKYVYKIFVHMFLFHNFLYLLTFLFLYF